MQLVAIELARTAEARNSRRGLRAASLVSPMTELNTAPDRRVLAACADAARTSSTSSSAVMKRIRSWRRYVMRSHRAWRAAYSTYWKPNRSSSIARWHIGAGIMLAAKIWATTNEVCAADELQRRHGP